MRVRFRWQFAAHSNPNPNPNPNEAEFLITIFYLTITLQTKYSYKQPLIIFKNYKKNYKIIEIKGKHWIKATVPYHARCVNSIN